MRGEGSIYKRHAKSCNERAKLCAECSTGQPKGRCTKCRKLRKQTCDCLWWVSYRYHGRGYDESAKTTNKTAAKAFLRTKLKQILTDKFMPPSVQNITIEELVNGLIDWYRAGFGKILHNRERFIADVESRWKQHLSPFFGKTRANALTTDVMREYRKKRLEESMKAAERRWLSKAPNNELPPEQAERKLSEVKRLAKQAANTTINRELQILRKAYRLASESEPPKVQRVPKFQLTPENNARKVFIDPVTVQKLKAAAAQESVEARAFLELAFAFGWRRGTLLALKVGDVELVWSPQTQTAIDGTIRYGTSKNGEPLEARLTPTLLTLLQPLVLHRNPGEPLLDVKDFRYIWRRICKAAGVEPGRGNGYILHDTRRTSARSKRSAGVAESVAMDLIGWKSPAMFRRYGIVDANDRLDALRKQEEYEARFTAVSLHGAPTGKREPAN
jgi:integrase-like protein